MKRITLFALLGVLALLWVSPASAQTENLLIDPGFEGEFYNLIATDPADGTRFHVPAGWSGGVITTPGTPPWINTYPSGFPHTAGFKMQGGRSFHLGRGGGTFTAYIYQMVYTQPGSPLEGGAWAYVQNDKGGRVRAGIDPTGGADPFSPNVVWGSWSEARNGWVRVSSFTTAQAGTATLILYATQETPSDPNGVYWDDAYFNGVRGVAPLQPGLEPVVVRQMVTATSNMRVRRGPGLDTARIGAMNAGESYPLVEDLGNWYAIEFNGETGYVSSLYATIGQGAGGASGGGGSAPVSTGASIDYIVDYTLRMRVSPGQDSAEVAVIPFTETVQAVARSADSNWLLVNYGGQSGWVASWVGRLQGAVGDLPVR